MAGFIRELFVGLFLLVGPVLCCIDVKPQQWANWSGYELRCPTDAVIVDLNVEAGLGKCKEGKDIQSECEGLTPYLIENKHNCYWQNNCLVRIPNWRLIDIIVKSNKQRCFGRNPDYFRLSDVRCFPKKSEGKAKIIDSSTQKVNQVTWNNLITGNEYCTPIHKGLERGIIRSHNFYPWDYEGARRDEFKDNYYCFELATLDIDSKQMFITVKDFDMWETDSLILKSRLEKNGAKIAELNASVPHIGHTFSIGKTDIVQFLVHVHDDSLGGRGFVLCFAHMDFRTKGADACAEVVSSANICEVTRETDVPYILSMDQSSSTTTTTQAPVTCKTCKKECKKIPKTEKKKRRACNKSCRPICKKTRKPKKTKDQKGKGRKGKKKDKGKKSKRNVN